VGEALDAFHGANPAAGTARALAVLEGPVEERRYGAALALARWKDPATVPAVAARVKSDPAMAVRRKCCCGDFSIPCARRGLPRVRWTSRVGCTTRRKGR